jgi:hypothetical protein
VSPLPPQSEQPTKREKESNIYWRRNAAATKIREEFRKKNESWPTLNGIKNCKSSGKREKKKDFKESKRFKRSANAGIKSASGSSKSTGRSVKEKNKSFK